MKNGYGVVLGALSLMSCIAVQQAPAPRPEPAAVAQAGAQLSPGARSSLAGSYTLVLVNGQPLPYVGSDPDAPPTAPKAEVLGGGFVIRPDATFIAASGFRVLIPNAPRTVVRPMSGRIESQGATFTAYWDGMGRTPVTVIGDTLVIDNLGMKFAYLRMR